jgi:putative hydrolase of the HAD superfamily
MRKRDLHIRAVIFDYGEVLCYPPTAEEIERMASIFEVSPEVFREFYDRSRLSYDRGDFTAASYWSRFAEEFSATIGDAELQQLRRWDVEMWSRTNSNMLAWLQAIYRTGVKTAILSNMPTDMVEHLRRDFAWLENFTCQTFSCELRTTKPDRAIYEHCLGCLDVAPGDALFIDDRGVNVQGARALGINAIRFESTAQLTTEIKALQLAAPLPFPEAVGCFTATGKT